MSRQRIEAIVVVNGPLIYVERQKIVALALKYRLPDLPIELPTTFELAINAKTARALGVVIPSTILTRANRIVQ
jgi:ABC-type uncharacterized transport system substrate-binding protein